MTLQRLTLSFGLVLLLGPSASAQHGPATGALPQAVSFERFELENGLVVIVAEAGQDSLAQVRVLYRVGERDARPGQRSLAHFYEHLAAFGPEGERWEALGAAGATGYDATTRYDYTTYYASIAPDSLAAVLRIEADRMVGAGDGLTEADLVRERAKVRAEEDRLLQAPPMRLLKATWDHAYPEGHPYDGFDIASTDMDVATLESARAFFVRYYVPANAVLVVAGDVEAEHIRPLVESYFGGIPSGSAQPRERAQIAPIRAERVVRLDGVLPEPHLRFVWNVPGAGTADAAQLRLAAYVLGGEDRRHRDSLDRDARARWASVRGYIGHH